MLIKRTSIYSRITREMDLDVTPEEYNRWKLGTLIQSAMPRLNVDEREFVMTGMTREEFTLLFADGEDTKSRYL